MHHGRAAWPTLATFLLEPPYVETTMHQPSTVFRLGDRIVARHMIEAVPPGSYGTIVAIFHSAPGFYDVIFDGGHVRHVIDAAELNRLNDDAGGPGSV